LRDKGTLITQAIFLRPKCYGFITKTGYEKVVVAGFPKNTLSFKDLERVLKGESIMITRDSLQRDFQTLKLTQTKLTRTLSL
jgi:hypothetical protein